MKEKSNIIPFWMYPYSWGLKGKARQIAEANYYLSGIELDKKLLEISKDEMSKKDFLKKELDIKRKYFIVTNYEYDLESLRIYEDEIPAKEFKQKELEINLKHKIISDYEFKLQILNLKVDEISEEEFSREMLELNFQFGKVSEKEYHRELIKYIKDKKQADLAAALFDYSNGIIGELEYQKRVATINEEPWVTVLNMNFGGKNSLEGSFELDWNQYFINKLKSEGYSGITDESIVNQWFMEVCKNVALEEFDGVGDFSSNADANLEAVKRWSNDSMPGGRRGYG